jgi:hypothetical protein
MCRLRGLVLLTTFRALLFLARNGPQKIVDMRMIGSQGDIRNDERKKEKKKNLESQSQWV